MRIVMFSTDRAPFDSRPRVGVLREDGSVVDIETEYSEQIRSSEGAEPLRRFTTVEDLVLADEHVWKALHRLTESPHDQSVLNVEDVRLTRPLSRPNSLRDFIAFEDHARAGAARRNEELNPVWRERPLYYKGNHRSLIGPGVDLVRPRFTTELDFEMEVAAIVGRTIRDADVAEAGRAIFGLTVLNDWSARDVQRAEMAARLGPAKSKDFASSVGPCVVTADEFGDLSRNPSLTMKAEVNGETVCTADLAEAYWSFAQMISFVSQEETVWATDVYGSGTPFGGCMLDRGGPYLEPGDTVEITVEKIGTLRNAIR